MMVSNVFKSAAVTTFTMHRMGGKYAIRKSISRGSANFSFLAPSSEEHISRRAEWCRSASHKNYWELERSHQNWTRNVE